MAGVQGVCRFVVLSMLLAVAGTVPLVAQDRLEGARLFASSGCTQCHGVSGQGTKKGPSLRDVHRQRKAAQVQHQIVAGGGAMPAFETALDARQIRALVVFLMARHWVSAPPEPPAPLESPVASN